jgi:hypothetical protein
LFGVLNVRHDQKYTSLLVLLLVNEIFLLAYSLLGLVYTLTSCK